MSTASNSSEGCEVKVVYPTNEPTLIVIALVLISDVILNRMGHLRIKLRNMPIAIICDVPQKAPIEY